MPIRPLSRALLLLVFFGPLLRPSAGQDSKPTDAAESWIAQLHVENVDARRASANKLRFADRKAQRNALPAIIDRLKNEKDGQVRLAILDAVTSLGPDAAPAVDALVQTLRTNYGGQGREESHQDYRAALALAAVGKPAVEPLRLLLKERKESVRAEVIMALGRIGPDASSAVADLIPLLSDKSERIQREASLALGQIGKDSIDALIEVSHSTQASTRIRALESLGNIKGPEVRAIEAVRLCVADSSPEIRAAALRSLARFPISDDVALATLREKLQDDDERVRRAVVNWLVERRDLLRKLSPELVLLLTSENEGISHHAAYLLGKAGPKAAPELLKTLHDKKSRIPRIAEALAQVGRPSAGLLLTALEDSDPRVRQGAALALGQLRPLAPGTAQKLAVGLKDGDHEVKAASLIAVGYLGSRAGEIIPEIRSLLNDDSGEIRLKAVEILYQSAPRDDQLVRDLASRLNDVEAKVQRQAIVIIRSLGPLGRVTLPEVITKLSSPHPDVRLAAAEMVGSHGQAAIAAVPGLVPLLDDPDPKIRMTTAQALGKLGKAAQPSLERLTNLLNAQQFEVREAAAATLGSLELDADVLRPHLSKALHDGKFEVRRAAMRSIQRLGPQGAIFVPDLILLAENKENLRSVERILRRFERSGPDARSLPELVKQLNHNQDNVRLLAIKFIGLAGRNAQDAIPALERMREDPNAEVRKQAEAASEQIKNQSATQPSNK